MGVNGRIFQNCAVLQTELSADGRTGFKFLFVGIVVHGEGAAALDVNDTLHYGILQRQLAAVFHNNADTAENLHVDKRQIAAVRDVERLRNFARFDLFPGDVIAKEAVGAAFVGAEPDFQIFWHTDAVFFTSHIAAEVFNGPRLHDVPCIQAAAFVFLQIFGFQLVCQSFLTGVDAEGQFVAVRSASLIVLYMNGDQVAARVLGRAVQRQVTAEGHVDTLHAAVLGSGHTLGGVRYDADGALAAHQTNFGLVVQFFPIFVRGFGVFFHQSAVHGHGAVLVAGSAADTGAGNAVVILLADNSGFKAAFDFHMQLINVAGCGVGRNRCAAAFVNHQLEHQVIVALGGDGDNVAAFQNVRSGAEVFFFGKSQNQCGIVHIVPIIFAITSTDIRHSGPTFPWLAVYRYPVNCVDIAVTFRSESYIPIISGRIALKLHLRYIDGALFRDGGLFRTARAADRLSGSIAVIVQHKLEGQVIVSRCRDGDNIAALDCGICGAKACLRNHQLIIGNFVLTTTGNIRSGFPRRTIHRNSADFAYITVFCNGNLPIAAANTATCNANLAQINRAIFRCVGLFTLAAGAAGIRTGVLNYFHCVVRLVQLQGQIIIASCRNDASCLISRKALADVHISVAACYIVIFVAVNVKRVVYPCP